MRKGDKKVETGSRFLNANVIPSIFILCPEEHCKPGWSNHIFDRLSALLCVSSAPEVSSTLLRFSFCEEKTWGKWNNWFGEIWSHPLRILRWSTLYAKTHVNEKNGLLQKLFYRHSTVWRQIVVVLLSPYTKWLEWTTDQLSSYSQSEKYGQYRSTIRIKKSQCIS